MQLLYWWYWCNWYSDTAALRLINRWGEFELTMRVFFTDTSEKPVEIVHLLRLFPPDGQVGHRSLATVSQYHEMLLCTIVECSLLIVCVCVC
jgi:hypothetical protein